MPRSSERDDTTGRRGGCGGTAGSGELGRAVESPVASGALARAVSTVRARLGDHDGRASAAAARAAMVLIAIGRGAFASGHLDSCRICVCGMCRGHGAAGARCAVCARARVSVPISKSCADLLYQHFQR